MTVTEAPAGGTDGRASGATPAAPAPVAGPGRSGEPRRRMLSTRNRPLWMLIPGGVLMTLIILVPLAVGVMISVLDLDQYTLRSWLEAPFIGVGNFVEAVTSSIYLRSVGISVGYALISVAITVPIGTAAALATQNRFPGRGLVRSIFLIPYVLPAFVVATLWRAFLQPKGAFDQALGAFGIDPGLWLNGPQAFWTLVIVQSWLTWPFIYLLVLAGLQSVDAEVHEAAAIDGAGWWRKLTDVVFPYLRGSIALAAVIAFLHIINGFTLPFVLFGVPVPQAVDVLPVLTYVTSFQSFRFGLSAAMALGSVVILLIPLIIYLRAVRLDTGEDGATK